MSFSLKHKAFRAGLATVERVTRVFSDDLYYRLAADLVENINLTYPLAVGEDTILFHCDSDTVRIRARRALTKEPDTIAWIDTFQPGEVFWDVGANIGVYALYAATVRSATVAAFDPLPYNYAGLIRNLSLNDLHDRVMAFCVALADQNGVAKLYVSPEANTPGGANCPFGDRMTNYGETVDAVIEPLALGYSIDGFLDAFDVPFPNHIKVDIDGPPDPVIAGATTTLRDNRLKSVMLELQPTRVPRNRESFDFIMETMKAAGFAHRRTAPGVDGIEPDPVRFPTNNFFSRSD